MSALQGSEFRSETGKKYRGKGLPEIYDDCCKSKIKNLRVISGKAKCLVKNDSTVQSELLTSSFDGTMFSWEISKGE